MGKIKVRTGRGTEPLKSTMEQKNGPEMNIGKYKQIRKKLLQTEWFILVEAQVQEN